MISCDRLEGIRFNRKFLVVKQACRKDTLNRTRTAPPATREAALPGAPEILAEEPGPGSYLPTPLDTRPAIRLMRVQQSPLGQ